MQKNGGMLHSANLNGFPMRSCGYISRSLMLPPLIMLPTCCNNRVDSSCCYSSSTIPDYKPLTNPSRFSAPHLVACLIMGNYFYCCKPRSSICNIQTSWTLSLRQCTGRYCSHELYLSLSWCNGKCCSHELYLWASITWYILLHKQACN